jgi:hypothetical protein
VRLWYLDGYISRKVKKVMRDLTFVCIYAAHCVGLALDVCMYSTSKYTGYIRYERDRGTSCILDYTHVSITPPISFLTPVCSLGVLAMLHCFSILILLHPKVTSAQNARMLRASLYATSQQ